MQHDRNQLFWIEIEQEVGHTEILAETPDTYRLVPHARRRADARTSNALNKVRPMDGLALTSVITSGVVGVSGIGVAVWTSKLTAALAREDRKQQRIADAYLEVLSSVEREGQWIQARGANLVAHTDEYYEGPIITLPKPDLTERAKSAALLGAFGSKEAQQRYRAWAAAAAEIDHEHEILAWNFQEEGGDPNRPIDPATLENLLERLQPAEAGAREALAEAVAHELGHR